MNPWTVLDLEQNEADPVVIRMAYKRAVQSYHPDRFCEEDDCGLDRDGWTERFKIIQLAYEILTDPEKLRAWINGDDPRARENRVRNESDDMLRQVVDAVAAMPEGINFADEIRARLKVVQDRIQNAIHNETTLVQMRERILARLGGEKDDLLHVAVSDHLEQSRRALDSAKISLDAVHVARESAQAFIDPGYAHSVTVQNLYLGGPGHTIRITQF